MNKSVDFSKAIWLNEPGKHQISSDSVSITTDPGTDFWQRTYYGFRNDNAPALQLETHENFTFTVKASFDYSTLYDQCGLVMYLDSENWFKASIEYENDEFSRLGSVVTNNGYSDWATVDISLPPCIWYRLSRRGPDFLIESSFDGRSFTQMRVFHMHKLGETTKEMGTCNPPQPAVQAVSFGLYACSPLTSSFTARFTDMTLGPCEWLSHLV